MSQGIIYLIINKENGHKYIGQTILPLNKIWQQHIEESKRMSSAPLHKAFRKFGIDKFIIKMIDECDENSLNEREYYWIKQYKSNEIGYNNASFMKEDKPPVIEKKEVKESNWGKLTEENRGNGKHSGLRILGLNVETGEEKIWESARDAALEVAGDPRKNSNILSSARNGYKCYGYRWRILDNKTKKKSVIGVHKKTWGRIEFESMSEACKIMGRGSKATGLIKSLRNPHRYSWKGYYWYYT